MDARLQGAAVAGARSTIPQSTAKCWVLWNKAAATYRMSSWSQLLTKHRQVFLWGALLWLQELSPRGVQLSRVLSVCQMGKVNSQGGERQTVPGHCLSLGPFIPVKTPTFPLKSATALLPSPVQTARRLLNFTGLLTLLCTWQIFVSFLPFICLLSVHFTRLNYWTFRGQRASSLHLYSLMVLSVICLILDAYIHSFSPLWTHCFHGT